MSFAPKVQRGRRIAPSDVDFGPTYATSEPRLRYQRQGRGNWRFLRVGTGETVGPAYASERELLADVARFAACLDAPAKRPPARRKAREAFRLQDEE